MVLSSFAYAVNARYISKFYIRYVNEPCSIVAGFTGNTYFNCLTHLKLVEGIDYF